MSPQTVVSEKNIYTPESELFSEDFIDLLDKAEQWQAIFPSDRLLLRTLALAADRFDEGFLLSLLALLDARNRGSLCLTVDTQVLCERFRFADNPQELADKVIDRTADFRLENRSDSEKEPFCPVVLHNENGVERLYLHRYRHFERRLQQQLDRFFTLNTPLLPDTQTVQQVLQEILVEKPVLTPSGTPVQLNELQKRALLLAGFQQTVVVSGGPGTGKTSVVVALLRYLLRCGFNPETVALAAPTGKAAQRMTESLRLGLNTLSEKTAEEQKLLQVEGQTIHRLLGFHGGTGFFKFHSENPLQLKLVVIDEVSMVDVELMAQLLEAIDPANTKLILLGDKDQLPSVSAGAILRDLLSSEEGVQYSPEVVDYLKTVDPGSCEGINTVNKIQDGLTDRAVVLEKTYRSQQQILDVAEKINTGQIPVLEKADTVKGCLELEGVKQYVGNHGNETGYLDDRNALLQEWAKTALTGTGEYAAVLKELKNFDVQQLNGESFSKEPAQKFDRLFLALNGFRILTMLRGGLLGVRLINRQMARIVRPQLDWKGSDELFHGMPVMILRNDYRQNLFNGDIGVVLRAKGGVYWAVFPQGERYKAYPPAQLPQNEQAFAMTVHKSQGSEYGKVLFVFPPKKECLLLTKEIFYTGVTRAKDGVLIYAGDGVVQEAVKHAVQRESGLHVPGR